MQHKKYACASTFDKVSTPRTQLKETRLKKKKKKTNKQTNKQHRGCLVCVLKQQFSVFKQHFTHFNIFFHPRIFTNIFK